jgi:hypothetical protein
MPASISELVGVAKSSSDLESRPMRIRYNESQTIRSGSYFRMTFPKVATDLLDLRSIKMRFRVNIAGEPAILDASDARCIFNRVRCLSGSQVLMDISEASLMFQTESLIETSTNANKYERYLQGRQSRADRQAYPNGREYITSLAPAGSLLNCDAVLPLSRLSDLHVEFWMESSARALFNGGAGDSDFSIEGVEILCDYIRSPSLTNYFSQNALSFHVTDYSHRFNTLLTEQGMCRFSSAHTSLNKVITILRPQAQVSGLGAADKLSTWYSGENVREYNLHLNSQLYFEQAIDSTEQAFTHFLSSFPKLATSEHFDTGFNAQKHLFCVDVTAAPASFQKEISSGTHTANLNSPLLLKIDFTGPLAQPLRADSYLMSDALIYMDGSSGDLKIRY